MRQVTEDFVGTEMMVVVLKQVLTTLVLRGMLKTWVRKSDNWPVYSLSKHPGIFQLVARPNPDSNLGLDVGLD